MQTKVWYQSKTVWLAILQGIVGILTAVLASDPALKGAGVIATVKSLLDIFIRSETTATIALK